MKKPRSSTALLLLAATVITWMSCNEESRPHPPICNPHGLYKHIIPDSVAMKYQHRFLESYAILKLVAPDTFLAHHFRIPNAETFSREALCALINYPHVDSVRIFYGEDSTGGFRLVMLGVDRHGQLVKLKFQRPDRDVSDTTKPPTDDETSDALENGQTCPPCMIKEPPPTHK